MLMLDLIHQTRESMFHRYPNTEKYVEIMRRSRVFLNDFKVFGYLMKHFRVFDMTSQMINSRLKLAKFYGN